MTAKKHGGKREGAGRKPKPIHEDDGGEKPVDFMLKQMRNPSNPLSFRADMAKAAAPYCSAKLISKDITVDGDLTIELVSHLESPNTKP